MATVAPQRFRPRRFRRTQDSETPGALAGASRTGRFKRDGEVIAAHPIPAVDGRDTPSVVDNLTAPPSVDLMGVAFHSLTQEEALDEVFASLDVGRGGWVIPTNLDVLRQQTSVPEWRDLLGEATLVVMDGMPLVWASVLAGTPVPERVAGSSLVTPLCVRAAREGKSVFFIGGAPGTAAHAADLLAQEAPGLVVAGTLCPPMGFENDPVAISDIRKRLQEARPDIVLVGLGAPKQERLIRTLRADLPTAWYLGVGITFSFITGDVRRAPTWVQRAGLEWMHRFAQEPGRLFHRYFLRGLPFATRLGSWALWQRVRPSRARAA
jgi:N-acetylglucosaminyldiphosphoundecaprenol N-acetyl-beta-D-mannosaminyltransferase